MRTDEEINQIVSRVLHSKFADFEGSTVNSETDFDGTPIIRVTARYRDPQVSPDGRIEAIHDLRAELLRSGEERFILLLNEYPEEETVEEDVE
jgi:hypothetical protein